MNFSDTLELEKQNLENAVMKCGALLKHLPKGRLTMQKKNNKPYYREILDDGSQLSIPRGAKLIEQLSSRRVAEKVMANAEHNKKLVDDLLRNYKVYDPNELVNMVAPAYRNLSERHVEAMGFPYLLDRCGSTSAPELHPEHLRHTDPDGNKRRSKSELSIGALYHELGMHPSYEDTVVLPDGFVFHPDFSVMSMLQRKKKYHEHIGNIGDPHVMNLTIRKFTELVTFGYYPFDSFIFTFEDPDGNINLQEIKILIETFMR